MVENKGYKAMAIIALVIGVIGVTLGYAAFESTLTIESTAEVTPDSSNFNVDFSTTNASVQAGTVTPTLTPNNVTGFTADNATINNTNDPEITGLHATFTEPGQKATYEFYSYNAGLYVAYLNSIVFSGNKTCSATGTTTQSLVDAACPGITLTVTVGSSPVAGPTTTSIANISGHSLGIGAAEPVTVEIEYVSGSAIADGDFEVTFPDIVLTYASAD